MLGARDTVRDTCVHETCCECVAAFAQQLRLPVKSNVLHLLWINKASILAGRCSAGACLCHGDYQGDSCEFFLLTTTRFLPDKDPLSATSRCHKAQHLASFTASVLSKHARFQRPTSCDSSTMFLQSRSTRGLGLTLRWLGLAMSQAILKGTPL